MPAFPGRGYGRLRWSWLRRPWRSICNAGRGGADRPRRTTRPALLVHGANEIPTEMGIEGPEVQAGRLHHFAHAYVLQSPFTEQTGSLPHNPLMLCGGLFGGIAHKFFLHPASMMITIDEYDGHHIWCWSSKKGIMKLTAKKALITGGDSGIGLATARLVIAEGAQVAISGRDQKTLDAAVRELGPNVRGYRADVTVAEDRDQLFAALAKDFGKLDIVFANTGISGRTPTGSTDEAIFENLIHTSLNGAFFSANSAAPLLNDSGSIILNGSVHNYLGQAA